MTSSTTGATPYVGDLVSRAAGDYIAHLQAGYRKDRPEAVARLAQLRGGAGKLPADVPELWGVTGLERFYDHVKEAFPDEELSESKAERAESAMFLAVTLYALHQQSQTEPMHQREIELGQAVRRLMPPGEIDEPLRRRFVRVGAAESPDVLADRLRGIVSLLRRGAKRHNRREPVPLDYALLAKRLYQFRDPDGARDVRDAWGRSFHAYRADAGDGSLDDPAPENDETKDSE